MASLMACWESSADDMDPPLTSAAACLFRGLNDRGEVFRLSWGRTSLDPLDWYTVGTASFPVELLKRVDTEWEWR